MTSSPNSDSLMSMENSFVVIMLSSILTQKIIPVRVPSIGHIDLLQNYQYSTGIWEISVGKEKTIIFIDKEKI